MFGFLNRKKNKKSVVDEITSYPRGDFGWVDSFKRQPAPGTLSLLEQFENTIYTCASINAEAVQKTVLRVYIRQGAGFRTRWVHGSVNTKETQRIRAANKRLLLSDEEEIVEVTDLNHPLIKLLHQPNEHQDGGSFIETTQLSMELLGNAYWLVIPNKLKVPQNLLFIPSQNVRPVKDSHGTLIYYDIDSKKYPPEALINIKFPNPLDAYGEKGVSPLRAVWEPLNISNKLLALEASILDNRARPDAIVSFKENGPSQHELERYEEKFNAKFRMGGNGRIAFMDGDANIEPLSFAPKDLVVVEMFDRLQDLIANAYRIPLSFLRTESVNRANMETARELFANQAIIPRLRRLEMALNNYVVKKYDPSGRTFVAYDDPSPENQQLIIQQRKADAEIASKLVQSHLATANEVRTALLGLPPSSDPTADQLGGFTVVNITDNEKPKPEPEEEPEDE